MTTEPRKVEAFPDTVRTWIGEQLDQGTSGQNAVNQHLMAVYAEPLKIYLLGSSWRTMGDPDELVQGFFASRLDRSGFLTDWQASGLRLRRWLVNGFLFYMRETWRRHRRDGAASLSDAVEPTVEEQTDAFDRAWARSLVHDACDEAASACAASGQQAHWDLFIQHTLMGRSFADLAQEQEVTAAQATVMARTAMHKLRRAVRARIARDGGPEVGVDREIRALLEVLGDV